MECGNLPRNLIQVLADALHVDTDGNIFLNTSPLKVDCNTITPVAKCGRIITEPELAEGISTTDECGNPSIRLGEPEEEEEEFVLGDPVWDDLRAPASGINPVGSPSPATPNTTDGSLTFGKGNVATAWFQMPHQWLEGSNLHLHIHWAKATSAAGVVHWQMKYKWANIGDVMPGFSALTDGAELTPNLDTANLHALLEWDDIDGTGKTISSMLGVFLQRTNDGTDTYAGNAILYEIDLHFQIDSLGSTQEYIK